MSWQVLQEASIGQVVEYSKHAEPWARRVADWWKQELERKFGPTLPGEKPPGGIQLGSISLVMVRVPSLAALYEKQTPLIPVASPNVSKQRPFLLYYAIPPEQTSGWRGAIHILGLALTDKIETTRVIGDLLHTLDYKLEPEASLRWFGSTAEGYWFTFCFSLPQSVSQEDEETTVSTEHIAYRAQLADVFWTNKTDARFTEPGGDGYEMLCQLHEASAPTDGDGKNYFELGSDRGREREQIAYWMFALSVATCPKSSFQKKKRAHFERELLRFRLTRYFFKEWHYSKLIDMNKAQIGPNGRKDYADPGEREIELYRARRRKALEAATASVSPNMAPVIDASATSATDDAVAKEKLPAIWISIPEEHAGKEIVGNPLYDIDEGRVMITYHDLFQWVWTRMEIGVRELTAGMADNHRERSARVAMAYDRDRCIHSHLVPFAIPCEADPEDDDDDGGLVPMDEGENDEVEDRGDDDEETRAVIVEEENAKRAIVTDSRKPIELIPPEMRTHVVSLETAHRLVCTDMALRQLHYYAKAEDDRDNAVIEAQRLARLGSTSLDGLTIERVKQSFPPCMGRVIMDALVHRTHPKHKTRVSLVKFLLEAGFSIQDVDKLMYDMYEADRDYVYNEHAGRWDKEAYNTVFKDAVKHMHTSVIVEKRISAYGCAHLTGYSDRGQRGNQLSAPPAMYGCPFSSSIPGQRPDTASARSYLEWTGTQPADIEDILRHNHPQLCCSAYYLNRFPENNGIVINHPNQFAKGAVLVDAKKKRQRIDLSASNGGAAAAQTARREPESVTAVAVVQIK